MATANLGAAAFVYKGNWALGGGTGGNGAYKRMHVVRNNHSIWVAIVETEEEPTSASSEWALMLENADEQAAIALISPSVSTGAATNITGVSASVAVNVQKFGFTVSPMVGVEYREQGQTAWLRTSTTAATALGDISIPLSGLELETAYEIRAFVLDAKNPDIESFGEVQTFSTISAFVETPILSISGYPDNITTTPTLSTSAFSAVGMADTHLATTWRARNSGGTVVWESPNNTTNKTSIAIPAGYLSTNTAYSFEAIHIGATLGSSAVGNISATTANTLSVEYLVVGGGWSYNVSTGGVAGQGGEVRTGTTPLQIGQSYSAVVGAPALTLNYNERAGSSSLGSITALGGMGTSENSTAHGVIWPTGAVPLDTTTYGVHGLYAPNSHPQNSGNGGQVNATAALGVVVARYAGTVAKATGGTISISGGYVYHTFTASGTFAITG